MIDMVYDTRLECIDIIDSCIISWRFATGKNRGDIDQFFRVMKANEDRTVYVHCVANYRGSVFTFLYRVLVEGVPEEEARQDLESIWDPAESDAWTELINKALKSPRF